MTKDAGVQLIELINTTVDVLPELGESAALISWVNTQIDALFPQEDLVARAATTLEQGQKEAIILIDRGLPPIAFELNSAVGDRVIRETTRRYQITLRGILEQARDRYVINFLASSRLTGDDLMHSTAECLRLVTGSSASILWQLKPGEAGWLVVKARSGNAKEQQLDLRVGDGAAGKCASQGEELHLANLLDVPELDIKHLPVVRQRRWRSALFLPLNNGPSLGSAQGQVRGVASIYSPKSEKYSEAAVQRARTLARTIPTNWEVSESRDEVVRLSELVSDTQFSSQYYRRRLEEVHDAGKKLFTIPFDLRGLSNPTSAELEVIARSLESLSTRIQRLVRTQLGDPKRIHREKVDVIDVVKSSLREHHERLVESRINYSTRFPDYSVNILANRIHLLEILSNLIDNSIYFLSRDQKSIRRELKIRVAPKDDSVLITVWDNGPGISEEQRKNVFFGGYTTKGDAGSGIGLTSVRLHTELYGGTADVDSNWGYWTEIELVFPLLQSGRRASDASTERAR